MPHLYAEALLAPGLDVSFQWRYQGNGRELLGVLDEDSPVRGALGQAIERYERTVFELYLNKPTLIEWANSQENLQDAADQRELRLGGAHVFQQFIELLQGMQMMTDREDDPERLSFIHHNIGDVMGFIGQRSGSLHYLEQAALSYEQALEIRTQEDAPLEWGKTTYNLGMVMQNIGLLDDDASMLKQALASCKQAVNLIPREEGSTEEWSGAMCTVGSLLYQLGTHRRGARTLEQAVVALRNALTERPIEKNATSWALTQNNLAATMQALGEHEEDIGALEASIPLYDATLKAVNADALPLVNAIISANRASAMYALAQESDYLDMAEASVAEFERLCTLFDGTEYEHLHKSAQERAQRGRKLVTSLQV